MNHTVVSNGQKANSIQEFSNQFIDFTLLLVTTSALWFQKKNMRPGQISRRKNAYTFLLTDVSSNVYAVFLH